MSGLAHQIKVTQRVLTLLQLVFKRMSRYCLQDSQGTKTVILLLTAFNPVAVVGRFKQSFKPAVISLLAASNSAAVVVRLFAAVISSGHLCTEELGG